MSKRERRIVGTVGWRVHSVTLDIPEESAYISIGAVPQRAGQIWLDDVRLNVVDDSVTVTDIFSNLPRRPVNLDFEEGTY
ncbi:hypothetical protein [Streptomyces chartreusis]